MALAAAAAAARGAESGALARLAVAWSVSVSGAWTTGIAGNGDGTTIWCGKGDKKTRRGKRFKGSCGNARPSKEAAVRRIREKWQIPAGEPLPSRVQ